MIHVAFLRGMNVGTGHRITMVELAALFGDAGCTGVATFQAAGNVAFDGPGPGEAAIEAVLREGLGYAVPTYIRSAAELAVVASTPPFPDLTPTKPTALHVTFFKEPLGPAAAAEIEAASTDADTLRVLGRELYWLAGAGLMQTTIDWKPLNKLLADPGTNRNITTVRKLAAKYPPG